VCVDAEVGETGVPRRSVERAQIQQVIVLGDVTRTLGLLGRGVELHEVGRGRGGFERVPKFDLRGPDTGDAKS
jgi:hypothetical protein